MENELTKVCIWREARHESQEGQLAVVHVINNRSNKQKKSYYEIVTASMQFSSMTYKADLQLALYPNITDLIFHQICGIVDVVFAQKDISPGDSEQNALFSDPTNGATFYRNPKTSTSIWFDNAIRDGKLVKTVTIGNHDFYKEV